jgi:hypothetical protein
VDLVGVFQHDEPGVIVEGDAELLTGGAPVGEQPGAERGIDPSARHDLGAERRRARVQNLDLPPNLVRPDQLSLDQEFANGCLHDVVMDGTLGLADLGVRMMIPMVMTLLMLSHLSDPLKPGLEDFDAQPTPRGTDIAGQISVIGMAMR